MEDGAPPRRCFAGGDGSPRALGGSTKPIGWLVGLYSPRIREDVLSVSGLPVYGVLGNSETLIAFLGTIVHL